MPDEKKIERTKKERREGDCEFKKVLTSVLKVSECHFNKLHFVSFHFFLKAHRTGQIPRRRAVRSASRGKAFKL